jgi:ubiquinone/menaquinone biosynthesis C-methylase UbiE
MNLSKKYKEKFGHLEGVKSLGWGSDYSQQKRFDILLDIGLDINDSVLDVGCGYGDFSKNFVDYLLNYPDNFETPKIFIKVKINKKL